MHDDLKALLRDGWRFGFSLDDNGREYRATAKRGDQIERATAAEPIEALARAILQVQSSPHSRMA